MESDTDLFIDLIYKALEKELEDKLWNKWLVELQHMDEKSFISFENYKQKHFQQKETEKEVEEILEDAENILKMMNKS